MGWTQSGSRVYWPCVRYIFVFFAVLAGPAAAQQASTATSVRQAYGSRLNQTEVPAISRGVTRRLDTRIANRVNNRLATRIERYTVPLPDMAAAYRAPADDGSRRTTIMQAPLSSE